MHTAEMPEKKMSSANKSFDAERNILRKNSLSFGGLCRPRRRQVNSPLDSRIHRDEEGGTYEAQRDRGNQLCDADRGDPGPNWTACTKV